MVLGVSVLLLAACTSTRPPRPVATGAKMDACADHVATDPGTGFTTVGQAAAGTSLLGLVFARYPVPASTEPTKIAWRMTGAGPLLISAVSPDGRVSAPSWGPEPHTGSNWVAPGDEWGTGFVLTQHGCWTFRAQRSSSTASAHLQVE